MQLVCYTLLLLFTYFHCKILVTFVLKPFIHKYRLSDYLLCPCILIDFYISVRNTPMYLFVTGNDDLQTDLWQIIANVSRSNSDILWYMLVYPRAFDTWLPLICLSTESISARIRQLHLFVACNNDLPTELWQIFASCSRSHQINMLVV